jgi:hypothetical protein
MLPNPRTFSFSDSDVLSGFCSETSWGWFAVGSSSIAFAALLFLFFLDFPVGVRQKTANAEVPVRLITLWHFGQDEPLELRTVGLSRSQRVRMRKAEWRIYPAADPKVQHYTYRYFLQSTIERLKVNALNP